MNAYSNYEYPSGTNVSRDTKVLENLLPNWRKSDTNQILDGILIIGLKDYGKWAKHLYMYTWADSKTHQKRVEEITNQDKLKFKNRVVWKIKCIARTPKLISYMDRNKGRTGADRYSSKPLKLQTFQFPPDKLLSVIETELDRKFYGVEFFKSDHADLSLNDYLQIKSVKEIIQVINPLYLKGLLYHNSDYSELCMHYNKYKYLSIILIT